MKIYITSIKKIIQKYTLPVSIITLGLILRYQILQIPLSVDEGYWAYIGTLLLKGQKLFVNVWSTNPLFVYIPYILSEKFLGHGFSNLRLLGAVMNILTMVVIFLLARKTFGRWVAITSLLFTSIFAVSYQQEGHFILNGEHISQLPLFLSLLFLVYGFEKKGGIRALFFTLSGFFMGYVWQVREHYLLLHAFIFIYLLYGFIRKKIYGRDLMYYITGSLLPILFIALYLLKTGNLIEYLKGVYYYRYLYMQSSQSVVFDSSFFYIVNDRIGHLLWILFLAVLTPFFLRKEKIIFEKFWMVIVFVSGLIILLSTGNRLFNHYFLYLTYGTIIISAYGLVEFIKYLKRNYSILTFPVLAVVFFFSFKQFDLNNRYLLQFNQPKQGQPYKNLIIDNETISYLNSNYPTGRILFLGESIPFYYYMNRDFLEKFPGPGFFIYEPYKSLLWNGWFTEFKNNPARIIVEDYGIPDALVINEFKDYVNANYVFVRKINQHYIYRYKGI